MQSLVRSGLIASACQSGQRALGADSADKIRLNTSTLQWQLVACLERLKLLEACWNTRSYGGILIFWLLLLGGYLGGRR